MQATSSPAPKRVTPAPAATTVPAFEYPNGRAGSAGSGAVRNRLARLNSEPGLNIEARTATSTWPSASSGISRSIRVARPLPSRAATRVVRGSMCR